jgi:hypothetical protein
MARHTRSFRFGSGRATTLRASLKMPKKLPFTGLQAVPLALIHDLFSRLPRGDSPSPHFPALWQASVKVGPN